MVKITLFLKYNGREIYQVGGEMCHDLICILESSVNLNGKQIVGAKVDTERQKEAFAVIKEIFDSRGGKSG